MNSAEENTRRESESPDNARSQDGSVTAHQRKEARRWWIKLAVQPVLILVAGLLLFAGLGVAQRLGWISAGSGGEGQARTGGESVRYICSMMCTPPQSEPGRCPVCAMELVPATANGGTTDSRSVQIDPAAGGMIAVALMGVDINTALWVGFIALFGLAADDGIVMATYMRETLSRRTIRSVEDIRSAIYEAGLKRIRPCTMTRRWRHCCQCCSSPGAERTLRGRWRCRSLVAC